MSLKDYLELENKLLETRASGTATERFEDIISDQMDAVWYLLRTEERDVLRAAAKQRRAVLDLK